MNREQRCYFVKRVNEIGNEKIRKINQEFADRISSLKSVSERVLELFNKHKESAARQVYDIVVDSLERCARSKSNLTELELYISSKPWGNPDCNVALPFSTSCIEQYDKERSKLNDECARQVSAVREKVKSLIDKAMFCQLPDEFATMLEQFEKDEA